MSIATLDVAWAIPGGRFSVALDAIGAAFLLAVLAVPALSALQGHASVPADHPTFRRTPLAYGTLPGAGPDRRDARRAGGPGGDPRAPRAAGGRARPRPGHHPGPARPPLGRTT